MLSLGVKNGSVFWISVNLQKILKYSHKEAVTLSFLAVLCLLAQSCLTLCDSMDHSPPGFSVHGDAPGKNTGVGCHPLLQGIFPTQRLNPGLPHCRWILYHLTHQAHGNDHSPGPTAAGVNVPGEAASPPVFWRVIMSCVCKILVFFSEVRIEAGKRDHLPSRSPVVPDVWQVC